MSELLPQNPDNRDAEPTAILDDLMKSAQWPVFCEGIADWEASAVIFDRDEPDDRMEAMQRGVVDLGMLIGPEYYGRPCHVFGFAYAETAEGADKAETVLLSSTGQSWFMGCDMQYINGRWRILLEVAVMRDAPRLSVSSDDAQEYDVVSDTYYLRPNSDTPGVDGLIGLHVATERDDDTSDALLSRETVTYLYAMAEDASARIAQPDFAAMSAVEQRALLNDYLAGLDESFPRRLRDCEIVVDCTGAYAGYTDMPGMNFKEYVDWSDDEQGQGGIVRSGRVLGFSYIELEDIPADQVLSAATFVHGGVPYINLRSDSSDIIYHVPLTAVRDLL